jgi:hypothetical protein
MLMRIANKQTKRADLMASPRKKTATHSRKGTGSAAQRKGGNLVAERSNCTPAQPIYTSGLWRACSGSPELSLGIIVTMKAAGAKAGGYAIRAARLKWLQKNSGIGV